jgi:hypothetical protein
VSPAAPWTAKKPLVRLNAAAIPDGLPGVSIVGVGVKKTED